MNRDDFQNILSSFLRVRSKPVNFTPCCMEKLSWVQRKLDGHRVLIARDDYGCIQITGRRQSHDRRMHHHPMLKWLESNMPHNTILDGEMYVENGTSSDVLKAMISNDTRLKYSPFQVVMLNGRNLNDVDCLYEHDRLIGEIGFDNRLETESVEMFINRLGGFHERWVDGVLSFCQSSNWEGVIFKGSAGGRNRDWFKLKPIKTADLRVLDIIPGNGRYKGRMGALLVGLYHDQKWSPVAKVGTGFTDEMRDRFNDPNRIIDRMVEVEYQQISAHGKLIQPRFVRLRTDKSINDYTKMECL